MEVLQGSARKSAKRKRRCNTNEAGKSTRTNPYLPADDKGVFAEDETLSNVLSFIDETNGTKLHRGKDGMLVSESLANRLLNIISFVQGSEPSSLSRQDVASLLIPWVAKGQIYMANGDIQQARDLDILWRALAVCLETIVANNSCTDRLRQALSQPVLNKLVPFALQTTITASNSPCTASNASRSFALLTANLYWPKIDLFCNTILIDLAEHVANVDTCNNENILSIAVASLQLLKSLLKQNEASSKAIFQVIASKNVLLALAKLATVEGTIVKDILLEGLFHPDHHIEGFLSMNISLPDESWDMVENRNKGIFRCYQADLIISVWSLLGAECMKENQVPVICQLIVLLVHGFIAQSSAWQKTYRNRGQNTTENSMAAIQFRFWGNMAGAMLMKVERVEKFLQNGLSCFTSTLRLLLDNNVYHPTFEDKDHHMFGYLQSLSQRLVALLDSKGPSESLAALECMVKLNHLIVHDSLGNVLVLASQAATTGDCNHFHLLLCTLFDTYNHLRQLDHLMHILVSEFISSVRYSRNRGAVRVLHKALSTSDVTKTVSLAIASAPPGQTQALFDIFNSCIVEELKALDNANTITVDCISLVVALLVLLLRNLRVDTHTAIVIMSHCQESLSGSGAKLLSLLQKRNGSFQLARDGVFLCGWIVDLQNRCLFWCGADMEELYSQEHPEELLALLSGLGSDKTDPQFREIAGHQLQFLACQRIQQLHATLHQKQGDVTFLHRESEKEDILNEIVRLTDFAVTTALRHSALDVVVYGSADTLDPWILLAQFLPSWTPYCETSRVKGFLKWMLTALVSFNEIPVQCQGDLKQFFLQPLPNSADAKRAAFALLRDASFFDNKLVVAELWDLGFVIAGALASSNSNGNLSRREYNMRAAIKILKILRIGSCSSRSNNAVETVQRIVQIEASSVAVVSSGTGGDQYQAQLLANVRGLMTKIFSENITATKECIGEDSANFLMNLIISTKKISQEFDAHNPNPHLDDFLDSSEELLEAVAFIVCDENVILTLKELIERNVKSSIFGWDMICWRLLSYCVKGVVSRKEPQAAKYLANFLFDIVREFGDQRPTELLFLVGNALALTDCPLGRDYVSQLLLSCDGSLFRDDVYLAGTIALQQGLVCEPQHFIGHILAGGSIGVFEAAIVCKLVSKLSELEFESFLEKLLARRNQVEVTPLILRILLGTTEGVHRRTTISRFGQRILVNSIDSLRVSAGASGRNLKECANLLIELMKHKDMIVIKERDIARLLAQISCILHESDKLSNRMMAAEIFSSSTAIVMSLIQRFPKQLYTCVPSLMLSLQKLFAIILYTSHTEKEIVTQSREFGRLCELLGQHKDILKKHILGLIVDFVGALRDDMMPTLKKLLTPSVYFLIDMLSEYEVKQLNTLFDTTSKVLFRSFHEGFQKWHIYKGRF